MPDYAKSIFRYVLGIMVCQALLIWFWINLGADARATRYSSVQSLLEFIGDTQPQGKEYLLLAASAIRRSSGNVETLQNITFLLQSSS